MKELKVLKDVISQFKYVMDRKQKWGTIGIFFLLIIESLLELVGISIILPFIYAIMDMEAVMSNPYVAAILQKFPTASEKDIFLGIIVSIIVVYVIKNLIQFIVRYWISRFGCAYKKDVSTRMLSAYLHLPYIAFSQLNTGDVLRGIYNDVEGSYSMLSVLLNTTSDILGLVVIAAFLFSKDAFIAGGLMALSIMSGLVLYKGIRGKTREMGYRQREISAQTYKIACQAIGGIKDVMVMNRQRQFETEYEKMFEEKRKIEITYNCFLVIPNRLIETVFISGLILIVGVRYLQGVNNAEFIADLSAFALASVRIMPFISRIVANVTQLIYMRVHINSVYQHLQNAAKYKQIQSQHILECQNGFQSEIAINNLEWCYPESNKKVLYGVNLKIKKGEAIALIGESGAGKTTLADIILGLYTPQKGTVTVDGVSIFDIPQDWSKLIGYVPQSVYLLDDTIRNNVLFGEKNKEDDLVWKALEQAQLKDFVMTLPKGLDTIVGERGIKFSGGQRQRVAIARALYYNPDILVLDEATSALDNETEEAVMESIETLQGIKTLVIIAHRLSTIRKCDKIYEIKNGVAILRDKKEILEWEVAGGRRLM